MRTAFLHENCKNYRNIHTGDVFFVLISTSLFSNLNKDVTTTTLTL